MEKQNQPEVETTANTAPVVAEVAAVAPVAVAAPVDYKFTNIDCLDEDAPINGQQYVLLSFISPEGLMNCTVRGVKVRGTYDTIEKANKMAAALNKVDKYHHIFVGQVGKWLPWDPTSKQVEEEKYENDKLDSLMKKAHDAEMKMKDLNELAGLHKENMEQKTFDHEDRVKSEIKQAVQNYGSAVTTTPPAVVNTDAAPTTTSAAAVDGGRQSVNVRGLNRDRDAQRDRILKKVEETRQKRANNAVEGGGDKGLAQRQKAIHDETVRIAEKKQNIENIVEDKKKLEANLQKMKQVMAASTAAAQS